MSSLTDRDIHNYKYQIERCLYLIKTSKLIRKTDKRTIFQAYEYLKRREVSPARIRSYLYTLKNIAEMRLKNSLKRLDQKDIEQISQNLIGFSKETIREYNKALSLLSKISNKKIPKIEKIHNHKKKLPHFLTKDQVYLVIRTIKNKEARILTFFLWDTGARISEALNLKVSDLFFDQYGCRVRLSGKTGDRIIRLIESHHAIREHVKGKNLNDYVFNITYHGFRKVLSRVSAHLNIKLFPYIFRHSRATFLAQFLTHAQMCAFFGWTQGSKIANTYIHLSGSDLDQVLIGISSSQNLYSSHEISPFSTVFISC